MLGKKPIEATIWIIGLLLLRKKQNKAVALGEGGPASAVIVPSSGLGTSMEDDDEAGNVRCRWWDVPKHPQISRIAPEILDLPQAACRNIWNGAPGINK
jgi:uncharacterized protein YodC (DUF2158 family)